MSINWDLAPKGAKKLAQNEFFTYWINSEGECFDVETNYWVKCYFNYEVIATRPQEHKTIQDVLEAFPDGWPSSVMNLAWHAPDDSILLGNNKSEQTICTREEYEKARGEKMEQEWTHVMDSGEKCIVLADKPDVHGVIVIYTDDNNYYTCEPSNIKPIKPQISKAEAWDILVKRKEVGLCDIGKVFSDILNNHEVIDKSGEV